MSTSDEHVTPPPLQTNKHDEKLIWSSLENIDYFASVVFSSMPSFPVNELVVRAWLEIGKLMQNGWFTLFEIERTATASTAIHLAASNTCSADTFE